MKRRGLRPPGPEHDTRPMLIGVPGSSMTDSAAELFRHGRNSCCGSSGSVPRFCQMRPWDRYTQRGTGR